jgi:molybdate transport system substrate-binding protein
MRGDVRIAPVRVVTLLLVAALTAASCSGGDEDTDTAAGEHGGLVVFAPASLAPVFQELAPEADFTVAGSDELATRISEGATADVLAADSARYPEELAAAGYVERPQVFATNRLVLVVPADNPAGIDSVDDLGAPGVTLVVGSEGVPVGEYTRALLESLGETDALDNVVSTEDDVTGILDKVVSGAADGGFVYATDAEAAGDEVQAIELPAQALAEHVIAIAVESEHREAADAFVELVLSEEGRRALEEAGFGVPPG